jgi:hypothetical protein
MNYADQQTNSPFGLISTNPWQGVFGKRINIVEPKFEKSFSHSRGADSDALPDNDV